MLCPKMLIGTRRRFCSPDPVHEIIGAGDELPGRGRRMHVRLVETGDELDNSIAGSVSDPRNRCYGMMRL